MDVEDNETEYRIKNQANIGELKIIFRLYFKKIITAKKKLYQDIYQP